MRSHRLRALLAEQERALRATTLAQSTRLATPEIRALYTSAPTVTTRDQPAAAPAARATPAAPAAAPARSAG